MCPRIYSVNLTNWSLIPLPPGELHLRELSRFTWGYDLFVETGNMGVCPISFEGRKVSCPDTLLKEIIYALLKMHLAVGSILHCDKCDCLSSANCIHHLLLVKGFCIGLGRGHFVSELPLIILASRPLSSSRRRTQSPEMSRLSLDFWYPSVKCTVSGWSAFSLPSVFASTVNFEWLTR